MSETSTGAVILEHYHEQAVEHGLEPTSTMADQITREAEVSAVLSGIEYMRNTNESVLRVLEIGCGNGYLLQRMRTQFPDISLTGLDYSPDMVALANKRNIENCTVRQGDVCALPFETESFDVVVSERCLVNLLDPAAQDRALKDIHRILKSGGHLIFIEAFMDGLENLNRARLELGLEKNRVPHHNLWFDKVHFLEFVRTLFQFLVADGCATAALPPTNFLSTHYFVSRVLYPSVTKREVLYNTEFVKFFRFMPPTGNYSPIQLFVFKK